MAEAQEITLDDVIRAGRVLFGPAFAVEGTRWRDALKVTYRRRVLETHPDRARSLGRAEPVLVREFRAVSEAYRVLSAFRAGPLLRRPGDRGAAPRRAAPAADGAIPRAASRTPASASSSSPSRPEGLPRRRLRFAEYLYYSGRVRWSDLADALAWQRGQRPAVGRIAVGLGFLAPDDVGVILERRREAGANAIPFGEWALRLGYLTSFQLLATLGKQLRQQRPIGQFFVERGMLDPGEIDGVRRRILQHNAGLSA